MDKNTRRGRIEIRFSAVEKDDPLWFFQAIVSMLPSEQDGTCSDADDEPETATEQLETATHEVIRKELWIANSTEGPPLTDEEKLFRSPQSFPSAEVNTWISSPFWLSLR